MSNKILHRFLLQRHVKANHQPNILMRALSSGSASLPSSVASFFIASTTARAQDRRGGGVLAPLLHHGGADGSVAKVHYAFQKGNKMVSGLFSREKSGNEKVVGLEGQRT
jgi:hypothetical protein